MSDEQLARWISEHPTLIEMIKNNPRVETYLRTHKPSENGAYRRVKEEEWNQVVDQLKELGEGVIFTSEPLNLRRVRLVDWEKVLTQLDAAAAEGSTEWGLVGVFDQSIRTHIRQGRYKHIDPTKYEVTTRLSPGEKRSRAMLYMRRKVANENT